MSVRNKKMTAEKMAELIVMALDRIGDENLFNTVIDYLDEGDITIVREHLIHSYIDRFGEWDK